MKKSIFNSLFIASLFLLAVACQKKFDAVDTPTGNNNPVINTNKIAPDGFTFNTSKTINVSVTALTNDNKPMAGVPEPVHIKCQRFN